MLIGLLLRCPADISWGTRLLSRVSFPPPISSSLAAAPGAPLSLLLEISDSGFAACQSPPSSNTEHPEDREEVFPNAWLQWGMASGQTSVDSKSKDGENGGSQCVTAPEITDPTVSVVKATIRPMSVLGPSQGTPYNRLRFGFNLRILFPFKTKLAAQTSHGLFWRVKHHFT